MENLCVEEEKKFGRIDSRRQFHQPFGVKHKCASLTKLCPTLPVNLTKSYTHIKHCMLVSSTFYKFFLYESELSIYACSSQKRKNSVKLSVSFYAFGIYWRKSCSENVDEIDACTLCARKISA